MIITALGFVPGMSRGIIPVSIVLILLSGYWVTIVTIEKLGRKWIQIQGFLTSAFFR